MTLPSPIQSTGLLVPNFTKGSTYGQAFKSSSCYSFHFGKRVYRPYNQDGAKVLSGQADLRPLQSGCIISGCTIALLQ